MFSCSYFILLIGSSLHFFLSSWASSLSVLFIFSKNQLYNSLILCIILFISSTSIDFYCFLSSTGFRFDMWWFDQIFELHHFGELFNFFEAFFKFFSRLYFFRTVYTQQLNLSFKVQSFHTFLAPRGAQPPIIIVPMVHML